MLITIVLGKTSIVLERFTSLIIKTTNITIAKTVIAIKAINPVNKNDFKAFFSVAL